MPEDGKNRVRDDSPAISRRDFALGAAGSCAVLALGGVKFVPREQLLRPPGGQDEDWLLAGCLHCEKCREVCPHGVIAPAHMESGLRNVRTPRMDFKAGWCDFCENVEGGPRCMAVCPTAALSSADPSKEVIGIAQLKKEWCLAYRGMGCHECVDACPYGALSLDDHGIPVVDGQACNGCGACEFACISLSSGSLSGTWDASAMTDRAITVHPVPREG